MNDRRQTHVGLLILAGIGAGTLIGATAGLLLGRRAGCDAETAMAETVDELKEKAHQVLNELSHNVAGMRGEVPAAR